MQKLPAALLQLLVTVPPVAVASLTLPLRKTLLGLHMQSLKTLAAVAARVLCMRLPRPLVAAGQCRNRSYGATVAPANCRALAYPSAGGRSRRLLRHCSCVGRRWWSSTCSR